jgi:hypothetical protein
VTGLPFSVQGKAILLALDAYRENPNRLEVSTKAVSPLHLLAGVRSWSRFSEHAKCVEVRLDDSGVTLSPMRYKGPRDGHVPIPGKEIASKRDEHSIAFNLARAFDCCE